jgi:hypothetical protein
MKRFKLNLGNLSVDICVKISDNDVVKNDGNELMSPNFVGLDEFFDNVSLGIAKAFAVRCLLRSDMPVRKLERLWRRLGGKVRTMRKALRVLKVKKYLHCDNRFCTLNGVKIKENLNIQNQ